METFSALLALCEGNPPVTGGFPSQRPVTRSFDVFFALRLSKQLSKQSRSWWFETLLHSLWCHCNVMTKRHQSSTLLAFCKVNPLMDFYHEEPVMQKLFLCHDITILWRYYSDTSTWCSSDMHTHILRESNLRYPKTSNIRCTKSQILNVSCVILQLSLPNPLKPGVKSRMKM